MIELKKPQNGENVELMTDVQVKFIESDRTKETAADFNYLDLKKGDTDNSIPKSVVFEWKASCEATVQISEDGCSMGTVHIRKIHFCHIGHTFFYVMVISHPDGIPDQ